MRAGFYYPSEGVVSSEGGCGGQSRLSVCLCLSECLSFNGNTTGYEEPPSIMLHLSTCLAVYQDAVEDE